MKQKYIKELSDELVNYLVDELETEKKRVLQCMLDDSLEPRDGIYPTIGNLYIITETIYLLENEPEFFEHFLAINDITEYRFKKAILKMADIDEFSENIYSELNLFISDSFTETLKVYTD